jgi:hypothetical protein
MAAKGLVDGLIITRKLLRGMCEDCILGKQDKAPFDDFVVHETEPLERVHVDLWGQARTPSWFGAVYMMLISDGGTSLKFPLFLTNKRKETTTEAFELWIIEAEVQTGKKLRHVRMDLGGEFDNDMFWAMCARRGILIEAIPKDSLSANGHVERGNRTVIEGTRTQLIDADMDHRFWAEAATAHCYVRRFIPSSHHPDVVPWVAWFRQKDKAGNLVKLNISHLRVWGSCCWVKDLDHVEGKLGKQGWEGTMVGYMGRRGYRVYDPARGHIFQVQNIIFEEGEPHRTRMEIIGDDDPLPHDLGIFEDNIPATAENILEVPAPAEHIEDGSIPAPSIVQPTVVPEPLRRSHRVPKPTRAMLESEMYEREVKQARLAGKDWVHDRKCPTANAVDVDWDDFDDTLLRSPWVFASTVKGMILCSYREAMREADK